MIRVYCGKCKHLERDVVSLSASGCTHPDVLPAPGVTRTWYAKYEFKTHGDPKVINKDNNCQYFEEKPDES